MIFLRHETPSLRHVVSARHISSAHSSLRPPTRAVTHTPLHGRVRLYTVCTDRRAARASWPATIGGDSACFAGAGSRAPAQTPDKRPISAGERRTRPTVRRQAPKVNYVVRHTNLTPRVRRISAASAVLPIGFHSARPQSGHTSHPSVIITFPRKSRAITAGRWPCMHLLSRWPARDLLPAPNMTMVTLDCLASQRGVGVEHDERHKRRRGQSIYNEGGTAAGMARFAAARSHICICTGEASDGT